MQSDRRHDLFRTFRFRLAIYHVLLVSGALTATFIISFSVAKSSLLASGRKRMGNAIRQAQIAYFGGKWPEETEQLPEDLLEKFRAEYPTLRIGMVERETQPGGYLFEITGSTGSEWLEILAESTGRFWVADRKPLQEVFSAMASAIMEEGRRNPDLFIYSPDGVLLASTSAAQLSSEILGEIRRSVSHQDEPSISRNDSVWIGAVALYDGNLLCLVDPMDEMHRITRWAVEFFILLLIFFVPLSGWIGFFISRKAMAGVKRVAQAAGAVQAGNFGERVEAGSEGSEIEELETAFNDMVARIELLMRELRDVTVNIAHDLKTPVARIRGLLESVNWAEIPAADREQIAGAALEECDRIRPMIDSVLELAQAETGMLVMQTLPYDLAVEVREAIALFSSLAEDQGIDLAGAVPDEPVLLVGDRARMQRVIANLLDNALKFTPEGGTVKVRLESNSRQAVLTVQDTGPGIPEQELQRVFERFYRTDTSRTTSGYGLGLSLVSAFVKAMGGTVEIESASGSGCLVRVTVPLVSHNGA